MMPDVKVFPSSEALAGEAARIFADTARASISERGAFNACLSGGSTPKRLYEILGSDYASAVDWGRTHIFWSDERCVAPGRSDSNFAMADDALLSKIQIPTPNIHRIPGELPPEEAALAYELELKSHFNGFPIFDIMLLGMGEDGHTASIFPGADAVSETLRLAMPVYVPRLASWRATVTLPVINSSRLIMFLITGKAKAGVVKEVIKGVSKYPASSVRPEGGKLLFMLDEEAASML